MYMAHYLAKKISCQPWEILTWSTCEIIVSYGVYANEEVKKSRAEWQRLDAKSRGGSPQPPERIIDFYTDVPEEG